MRRCLTDSNRCVHCFGCSLRLACSTFSQFAARFGKRYKSLEEFALRSQKYAANWAMITAHNANPDATFKMAM